jgi:hypothetical protein
MATNTAMAVTGLILGLKPQPGINFQEYILHPTPVDSPTDETVSALVIMYLLSMAWITVIASLASCNRLSEDTKVLQLVSVIQSLVVVAFALAILIQAMSFGQSPECNQEAVAVIFRPFSALKSGRILGWVVVVSVVAGYTTMTARDITAQLLQKMRERERTSEEVTISMDTPSAPQGSPAPMFMPSAPAVEAPEFLPPVRRQAGPCRLREMKY